MRRVARVVWCRAKQAVRLVAARLRSDGIGRLAELKGSRREYVATRI